MLYPVKVLSPDGQHIKTVSGDDLFIADERNPVQKPAQRMPFELVTCRYCGDKVRARVSVRGIVARHCKKSKCRNLADKAGKEAKLKLQRGSRGGTKTEKVI